MGPDNPVRFHPFIPIYPDSIHSMALRQQPKVTPNAQLCETKSHVLGVVSSCTGMTADQARCQKQILACISIIDCYSTIYQE